MLRLVQIVDQALGYVPPTSSSSDDPLADPSLAHAHHHAAQTTPSAPKVSNLYYTATVQEKWVDHPKEYAEFEREQWRKEGERAIEVANEKSLREAGADLKVVERMEKAQEAEEGSEMEGIEKG